MSTRKKAFICERCLEIDFRGLTRSIPGTASSASFRKGHNKHHFRSQEYVKGCAVCELLCQPAFMKERSFFEFEQLRCYPFGYADMPEVCDSFSLEIWSYLMEQCLSKLTVGCVPKRIALGSSVQDTWDHDKARKWLQDCTESHSHWYDIDPALMRHKNIRLIDCVQRVIVDAEPWHRWIALSYVWGVRPHTGAETTDEVDCAKQKLPRSLPRTVEDAIIVTQQLGFRHLWVDEYCIDQHHAQRSIQIAEMDKVYRGAELTIVAAAGEDKNYGLPGVGTTPRKRIKVIELNDVTLYVNPEDPEYRLWKAKWFTRGWTLQEGVLSRRVLLFTEYQTLFYCPTGYATEGLGEFLTTVPEPDGGAAHSSLPAPDTYLEPSAASDYFRNIVKLYTARDLTYDSDALRALLGIFKNVTRLQPSAYNLVGLPLFYSSNSSAGVLLTHMVSDALSWIPARPTQILTRRSSFPSWTWVGWKGMVTFTSTADPRWSSNEPLISNVRLASRTGEIFSTSLFTTRTASERTSIVQSALDNITTLMFDAPLLSVQQYRDLVAIAPNFEPLNEPTQQGIVENLRLGVWACVFASLERDLYVESQVNNLLIVEWKEDGIMAERVAFLQLESRSESNEWLGESLQDLERRDVHLI